MGETAAVIGLIVSLVGTTAGIVEGSKARTKSKRQRRRQEAINAAKEASERRKTLREERVRRGQLLAQAEAAGIGGSSTALSGEAISGTLAAERIGQTSAALESTNVLSSGSQSIASSQARSQLFGNVSQIGSSVFQSAGGFETLEKIGK